MGTPAIIVSPKIEHASIVTTADIYGHVMQSDQAQANNAVEAFRARGLVKANGDDQIRMITHESFVVSVCA